MLQLAKQPRSSMHTPLRSTTHFACSSLASCSRPRAAAPAVRSRNSTNSNSSAAAGQLDSAASLVWGLQPTISPSVYAVIQYAFEPASFRVAQYTHIEQLDLLHPDLPTNPPFTEFLAKHLLSRTAARESVVALVLSATYLPSQLDTMRGLAGKQSLAMSVFLSSDNSEMHTVFYRTAGQGQRHVSIMDLHFALADSLGPLESLEPAQLQAAHAAEKRLQEELRLWDPATWSSVLQQRLESRKALDTWLLVDSLMGQVALVAARQLVLKKGLHWLELSPEQLQTANNRGDLQQR